MKKITRPDYKYFIMGRRGGDGEYCIDSGWEYREDAQDQLKEHLETGLKNIKILTTQGLKTYGLDPGNNYHWGNIYRKNPMKKITRKDIYVEKIHPSGAYLLSAIVNNQRVKKQYMGYSRKEAIADFYNEFMRSRKNPPRDPAVAHQHKIALDTLKLSEMGARMMGGMDHGRAIHFLLSAGMSEEQIARRMQAAGHSPDFIEKLLHYKSNPAVFDEWGKPVQRSKNLRGVIEYMRSHPVKLVVVSKLTGGAGRLWLSFENKAAYTADFASYRVMMRWLLDRRVLRGTPLFYQPDIPWGTLDPKNPKLKGF